MLVLQRANARRKSAARIGLAVAGGGPIGGMYELGALRALEIAIEGLDLTRLEVYVGVSSGAVLAASLANGIGTGRMCRMLLDGEPGEVPFRPELFLRPAFYEYLRRAAGVPGILLGWWRDLLRHPSEAGFGEVLGRLGTLIPTGLFDSSELERFLRTTFGRKGRTNDFRELSSRLYVVAVDLDSGAVIRFGAEDWDDVPISVAVQASAALPGLYPPVQIRGHQFVDGALRRTMHASVAMDHGIDLLIGLNPLVPFDASRGEAPASLVQGGLPTVLSQTFRTLLQSRMRVGLSKYETTYPGTDQIVLEPDPDDARMFFTNVFSYASRQQVAEHAFRATLKDLAANRDALSRILQRHGMALRTDVLHSAGDAAFPGDAAVPAETETTARLRRTLDDLGRLVRERGRTPKKPAARRPRRPPGGAAGD